MWYILEATRRKSGQERSNQGPDHVESGRPEKKHGFMLRFYAKSNVGFYRGER